jgi:AhpD family alkylhydroperoxidase
MTASFAATERGRALNDPGTTIALAELTTTSEEAAVTTARETRDELIASGRRLRAAIPGVYRGYSVLQDAAMGDGALSARTKELIALAIAVTRECDGCIVAHARSAHQSGATAAEVAEAVGVAILMNGGPGTVWGPRAYAAFEEFSAEARPPR